MAAPVTAFDPAAATAAYMATLSPAAPYQNGRRRVLMAPVAIAMPLWRRVAGGVRGWGWGGTPAGGATAVPPPVDVPATARFDENGVKA